MTKPTDSMTGYIELLSTAVQKIGQLARAADSAKATQVLGVIQRIVEAIEAVAGGSKTNAEAKVDIEALMQPLVDGLAENDAQIDAMLKKS